MNIILIGFMGSGKTVVGKELAAKLGVDFLDTDELIEKTEGRTISEIFKADGEEYFRQLETEVLKTLKDYDNFILATGGGIILKEGNIAALKTLGPVILLWADPAVVYERVKNEAHRPLLQVADPKAEIIKRLAARSEKYHQAADHKIDTSGQSPEQIGEEIIQWVRSKSI